ncbi:MAG: peptidylprolyl isomerase [Kiritimatiellae bacterium]|nr:peptidylprolyl isomerase [Kiritimatiellia bacterium]
MRFHKLIQSRLMWLTFLGVVVISFVFMDFASSGGDAGVSRQLRQPVAHINGEPLRFLEFDIARRQIEQSLNQPVDREQLDELVFSRFARLAKAKQLGIRVPRAVAENDLRQSIAQGAAEDPEFMERFRTYLRSQNMTESQLIDYTREELILEELQKILSAFAMIAPFDAERWAAMQTDEFALAVLEITGDALPEPEAADEDTLRAYFDENTADFEIPELRRIRFLTLNLSDFERGGDALTEAQAREQYEANPSRFDRQTPVMTEEGGFELKREPREFEEVKDEIIANHKSQQARRRANDEAMGLSVRLTPRRGRPAPEMADVANDLGLSVTESDFFDRNGTLPNLPGSSALVRAAFELDLTPVGRTSQPVPGREKVFIVQLIEIEEPRIPDFDEVREEVAQQWTQEQGHQKLLDFAASVRETLQAGLDAGQSIAEAARDLEGVELTDPPPFQRMNLNPNMPSVPFALAETLIGHTTGDLIGPVEDTRFGGVYLGYVLSREPREEDAADMMPGLENELAIHLQFQGIAEAFEESVLQPMIRRVNTPERATED